MWWAVGILAHLAIVGVIVLVAILAHVPSLTPWPGETAVILFISGILALLIYHWFAIRALQDTHERHQ